MVGVTPGKIHLLLNDAVVQIVSQKAVQVRWPTPPAYGPLEPVDVDQARGKDKKPLLPWRGKTEAADKSQDARIEALIGLMEAQVQVRPGPSIDVQVGPRQPEKPPVQKSALLWLWGVGGLALAGFIYYVKQGN